MDNIHYKLESHCLFGICYISYCWQQQETTFHITESQKSTDYAPENLYSHWAFVDKIVTPLL